MRLHFGDRRSFALLRYIHRAKIIVLCLREQKPCPVRFSCRRIEDALTVIVHTVYLFKYIYLNSNCCFKATYLGHQERKHNSALHSHHLSQAIQRILRQGRVILKYHQKYESDYDSKPIKALTSIPLLAPRPRQYDSCACSSLKAIRPV